MTSTARRLAALLLALVLVPLAACSDDDGGGATSTPGVNGAVSTPASAAELQAAVAQGARAITRAARRFERCDRQQVAEYGFNTCWPRTRATSVQARALLDRLTALGAPATYDTVRARLQRLSAAWPAVRKGCRTRNDQTCDQALARFRNDLQQAQWELEPA